MTSPSSSKSTDSEFREICDFVDALAAAIAREATPGESFLRAAEQAEARIGVFTRGALGSHADEE